MNTPITPLGDRVLVERVEKSEETRSGIILPKSSEGNDSNIGLVVAVGSGRETDSGTIIKPKVSVGQKVIFSWGDKVEIDGTEYHLISESSLLGVVEEGDVSTSSAASVSSADDSSVTPSQKGDSAKGVRAQNK